MLTVNQTATMSDLDAQLRQIRDADFITGDRLITMYNHALKIDNEYGTDLAAAIAKTADQINTDLAPYDPPF